MRSYRCHCGHRRLMLSIEQAQGQSDVMHETQISSSESASATPHIGCSSPPKHNATGPKLPCYVQPVPCRWLHEDIAYLREKKALSIPSFEFRNALLRSYVEWVHPYCPVLDLDHFLSVIAHPEEPGGQVSLLVLHAVFFAGLAFVDGSYLIKAGYASRLMARKEFFTMAKVQLTLLLRRPIQSTDFSSSSTTSDTRPTG